MSIENYIHIVLQFLPESNKKDIQISKVESGLINETLLIKNKMNEYILQKVNRNVFSDPKCIHDNYKIARKALVTSSYSKEVLSFIRDKNDFELLRYNKESWRMSKRIAGKSYEICMSPEMAYNSAHTLSEFHSSLMNAPISDYPISRFTDFRYRLKQFNNALSNAPISRAKSSNDLIIFVKSNLNIIEKYLKIENRLPVRVIHGDPKVSNFLFDENTNKVNALIDIDTIMPGTVLYDFGDMVRSFANSIKEDDFINREECFAPAIYEALLKGYYTGGKDYLTNDECKQLPLSVITVSLVQGMRFLTDYLDCDRYYQVDYLEQNLHRAENQFSFYGQAKKYLDL